MKQDPIGMLTMEKYDNRRENSVGSSRIRGRWVMKYCPEIQEFKNGFPYRAIIYQKVYWKEHMQLFKGIKIFDLCDPDWLEGRPIRELAELCDGFTVTTESIRKYLSQMIDKPIVVIPDRIDPEEHNPIKTEFNGKIRSVVWFGYSANQVVLDRIVNVLQGRGISLVVISDRHYASADVNIKYDYQTFCQDVVKHDAVLLPNIDVNLRHSFKSNNKTLTAWALQMPVIAEPEDLERFDDPEVRQSEAKENYEKVLKNWHVRQSGPEYIKLIEQLEKSRGGDMNV